MVHVSNFFLLKNGGRWLSILILELKIKQNTKLELYRLQLFGIGIIIGAGVYAVLGATTEYAGAGFTLSFLSVLVVAILTAFSTRNLTALHPPVRAEYILKMLSDSKLPSIFIGKHFYHNSGRKSGRCFFGKSI